MTAIAMPHSTTGDSMRTSPVNRTTNLKSSHETNGDAPNGGTEQFPDFDAGASPANGQAPGSHWQNGYTNGSTNLPDRWHAQRDSRVRWAGNGAQQSQLGHGRQKSLSNAIRHMRSGSMSQNAHEIADALRAPVSYKLIALCVMWYGSSALTNTSSKSILTAFDKPATLTLVQFAFVSSFCILFSSLASYYPQLRTAIPALKHPLRYPSRDVIATTMPLAAFQIFGHLLSSNATSKIPVSLVHTIKGLSPLFTVLAYRFIFDIRYPRATYFSLIPLTFGVVLACSGKHSSFGGGQFMGIIYALLAAMIFVTQNIFSKRLFNEAAKAEEQGRGAQSRKLDKLNLLCYSSGLAFLLTGPIWLWSEGIDIIGDFLYDGSVDLTKSPNSFDHGRLTLEFVFNGVFHFAQNILAFILLSMVSPVTYSVASLIKRVFVIIIAIIWFRNPTTKIQAVGIALTFLGLYLYDRSNMKNKADQRARSLSRATAGESILPLNMKQVSNGPLSHSPVGTDGATPQLYSYAYTNGHAAAAAAMANGIDTKKSDDAGRQPRARGASNAGWLPPGTKQEDTWRRGDQSLIAAR